MSCEELPQSVVRHGQVRFNAVAHPARPRFSVALEAQACDLRPQTNRGP